MKKPFISIVIPTRNRHETLYYTLQTILNQNYDDYEIIVSDNNSTIETKKVVKSLESNKIIYVRSNRTLTIQESYEFALKHINGTYVTLLADNDGLIKDSLAYVSKILKINNFPLLINFVKNNYNWPCYEVDNTQNRLILEFSSTLEIINGHKLLQNVLDNPKEFFKLPMIYNSIVHNSLIKKVSKKTKKIFNSVTPDVYSGMAFALLSKNYLKLNHPVTIAGNSAKSIGVNFLNNHKSKIIEEEINSVKKNKQFHHTLPYIMSHSIRIADCFFKLSEYFNTSIFKLDLTEYFKMAIIDVIITDKDALNETKNIILEKIRLNSKLNNEILNFLETNPLKIKSLNKNIRKIHGLKKERLVLYGDNFNIKNILDTSNFMSNFYDYSLNNIVYPDVKSYFESYNKIHKIAIWGSGEYGKDLLNWLKEYPKVEVKYIIDSFIKNTNVTPNIIRPDMISYDIDIIVIASSFIEDISKTILKFELHKKYIILNYYK